MEALAVGRPVELGSTKQRALLAMMLINHNRVVSTDTLIEGLWDVEPPLSANSLLQTYVSRLRRALGGGEGEHAPRVVARAGYLLDVDPERIDAHRFEALAESGRSALGAGDHSSALVSLQQALSCWRGSALADFANWTFAHAEASRLEELRMAVTEDLIECELSCGHVGQLIPRLEALIAQQPLRERLWGHLMVALYHDNRQGEALRAYQRLRDNLGNELGIEPAPALRQLEEQILNQRVELDWLPRSPHAENGTSERRRRRFPAPAFLADMGDTFVGRERELERLQRAWTNAVRGERVVVLIGGEPGIGKSRLVAELARHLEDDAIILSGRCDEDLRVPYQPFVEALRFFIDHTSTEDLGASVGQLAAELVRLVPELAERLPNLPAPLTSEPEVQLHRLFEAVSAWLAAASRRAPIVLVLDDLHWAAKPTTLLLRHVTRSAEKMRLLIVGIYSDGLLGRDHPLVPVMADLRRNDRTEGLSLTGLSQGEVATFIESMPGPSITDEDDLLARAIHTETQGNPLFVGQVLRHLAESGAASCHDRQWIAGRFIEELGIPEGVRELVGRRLSKLSVVATRILSLAAVQGKKFEIRVLQSAGDLDEEEVLDAIEETVQARLVSEVPGAATQMQFVHALVRATLYDEISGPRRARMHQRVAVAIEQVHAARLYEYLPALAYHFTRAATLGSPAARAVEYCTQAGHSALGQLAHAEAAGYFRQALEMLDLADEPDDAARRLELLILVGVAERQAGDPTHRKTLLEAARLARIEGDCDALARAALENSRDVLYSTFGRADTERIAALESAFEKVGTDDSATRARLLANLAKELVPAGDRERRFTLSDSALTMARRLNDPAVLADVLVSRHYTIAAPTTLAERAADADELMTLAEGVASPVVLARAHWLRFRLATESGDLDEADQCLKRFTLLAAELGQPAFLWMDSYARAGRALLAGQLQEAESISFKGYQIGRSAGQPDAPFTFVTLCFQIRLHMGELEAAGGLLDEFVNRQPELPFIASMRALLLCDLGKTDETQCILDRAVQDGCSGVSFDHGWLMTMTNLAAVCARQGDVDAAAAIRSKLAPFADQVPLLAGVTNGAVTLYLGLLARTLGLFEEAEQYFMAASSIHARFQAPVLLTRTQIELAKLLLARRRADDVDKAQQLLRQALRTVRDLRLIGLERQITPHLVGQG